MPSGALRRCATAARCATARCQAALVAAPAQPPPPGAPAAARPALPHGLPPAVAVAMAAGGARAVPRCSTCKCAGNGRAPLPAWSQPLDCDRERLVPPLPPQRARTPARRLTRVPRRSAPRAPRWPRWRCAPQCWRRRRRCRRGWRAWGQTAAPAAGRPRRQPLRRRSGVWGLLEGTPLRYAASSRSPTPCPPSPRVRHEAQQPTQLTLPNPSLLLHPPRLAAAHGVGFSLAQRCRARLLTAQVGPERCRLLGRTAVRQSWCPAATAWPTALGAEPPSRCCPSPPGRLGRR
jgi:hypothetical protein